MTLKKTIVILNILLVAVLGYVLSRPIPDPGDDTGVLRPDTVRDQRDEADVSRAPDDGKSLPHARPEDYSALAESDLFGARAEAESEAPQDPEVEPAEPLKLNLLGTVAGDSSLARAIIKPEGERRQSIYSVGDSVRGAEILQISRKRVLLKREGRHYELTMDITQAIEIDGEEIVLAIDDFSDVISAGSDFIEIDRDELLDRGGGMFALMRQVQDNLQVEPYMEDGEAAGLRLRGVENIGIAQLAGIREGDVVRSVNGDVVSSVPRAMQAFRRARHREEVSIEIVRNGERIEKSYRIK